MRCKRGKSDGRVMLSANYSLSDFIGTGGVAINNTPNPLQIPSLFALAALIEKLVKATGSRPHIVQAYQSPALQAHHGKRNDPRYQEGRTALLLWTGICAFEALAKADFAGIDLRLLMVMDDHHMIVKLDT